MRVVELIKKVKIDNKVFCNIDCEMRVPTSFGQLCVLDSDSPIKLIEEAVGQFARTQRCLECFK